MMYILNRYLESILYTSVLISLQIHTYIYLQYIFVETGIRQLLGMAEDNWPKRRLQ